MAEPQPSNVYSSNRRFILALDPSQDEQPVFSAADFSEPLWTLKLSPWHGEYHLSDDGTLVAVVSWEFVPVENYGEAAVSFYDSSGLVRSFSYAELCPDPRTTTEVVGPVGDFWCRWLWREAADGEELVVHAVDGHIHFFSIKNGELLRSAEGESMPMEYPWWQRHLLWLIGAAAMCLIALVVTHRHRLRRTSARTDPR